MKIVIISDTHGRHKHLTLPDGDLLLHAGDFSRRGYSDEVRDFLKWFSQQPHPHKVFIAGNHDFLCEQQPDRFAEMIPDNCIYLNDSATVINGIHIWGSPIQPWFHDWAFNRNRGEEIQRHWDLIPHNTDILLVHGPPAGILDKVYTGEPVGCENLRQTIEKIKPRLVVFGHIHEDYGMKEIDDIVYINASTLNKDYVIANEPVVFEWGFSGE